MIYEKRIFNGRILLDFRCGILPDKAAMQQDMQSCIKVYILLMMTVESMFLERSITKALLRFSDAY